MPIFWPDTWNYGIGREPPSVLARAPRQTTPSPRSAMARGWSLAASACRSSKPPAYFSYDALLNRRERPTLEQALAQELQPLSLEAVLRLQKSGAQVVDVRDPADFEGAHLAGSINIGLGGAYATWAGTLLERDT